MIKREMLRCLCWFLGMNLLLFFVTVVILLLKVKLGLHGPAKTEIMRFILVWP